MTGLIIFGGLALAGTLGEQHASRPCLDVPGRTVVVCHGETYDRMPTSVELGNISITK